MKSRPIWSILIFRGVACVSRRDELGMMLLPQLSHVTCPSRRLANRSLQRGLPFGKSALFLKKVHFRPRRSPVDSSVGASSLETRFRWFLAEILWPGLLRSRKHQSPSGGERSYISRQRLLILFRLFQQQLLLLVHRFNSLRIQHHHSFANFEPLQKRVSHFFNEIIERWANVFRWWPFVQNTHLIDHFWKHPIVLTTNPKTWCISNSESTFFSIHHLSAK